MVNNDSIKNSGILFNQLGFWIFRDINKNSQNGYVIYNVINDNYTYNLNLFDTYDYIRNYSSKKLTFALKFFMDNILKNRLNEEKSELKNLEKLKLILNKDENDTKKTQKNNGYVDSVIKNKEKTQSLSKIYNKLNEATKSFKTEMDFKDFLISFNEPIYNLFKEFMNYYKIIIDDTNYKPIPEQIYIEKNKTYLNKYVKDKRFLNLKPNLNAKFPHIERLIRNICGSKLRYEYFIKFIAYKIQFPLDVPPCHIIIRDDGGTGKSDLLLGDILENVLEVAVVTQNDLMDNFNGYMVGHSLVWCEEVEGFEDEKKLKALTGAKWINLNEKFEKGKKIKNYNNFIVVSNELRVMKITEKDRRWSIIGGGKRLVPLKQDNWEETIFQSEEDNKEFFRGYHKNLNFELEEFYKYLIAVKVERSDIQIPLNNKLKTELINMNKTSEIAFIDDIIDIKLDNLIIDIYGSKGITKLNNLIHKKDGDLEGYWVTLKSLYKIYEDYCKGSGYDKKIGLKMFLSRLRAYKPFNLVFGEDKIIKIDSCSHKCLKVINHYDENFENKNYDKFEIIN